MTEIRVPDIGSDSADVIEILVKPGDHLSPEQPIVVLESDKASMEVPVPQGGVVRDIAVKVGDSVKLGDLLLQLDDAVAGSSADVREIQQELQQVSSVLEPAGASPVSAPIVAPAVPAPAHVVPVAEASVTSVQLVKVPDIGSDEADVIEVLVKVGDVLRLEQPIVVLESAKASMEVPSPVEGTVLNVLVKVGDKVSEHVGLLEVSVASPAAAVVEKPAPVAHAASVPANAGMSHAVLSAPAVVSAPAPVPTPAMPEPTHQMVPMANVHAGPAVRRLARELGVDLGKVKGSGPKERILKDDVHAYVKSVMQAKAVPAAVEGGAGLPKLPVIDFSKWGEIERLPLTKIQRVSAQNLHRAWVTIPHVTQFDEADITELEAFRVAQKDTLKAEGLNLTVLAFLVKACAHVLRQFPKFNSSLDSDGENLVYKKYVHIGVAVDTPNGLVVPVIRDADKKSVREIARDMGELSAKARDKKLTPAEMQGACFSISSLGGIGGTAFTPIVNWPEVAILGVSRSATKPVWNGKDFQPRLMLPLSLSYDHRVIDGADAARFTTALSKVLADIRQLLL
ncbi:MAG TPA: dihydrolipoyllysine-residue acetyltransferase [Candidatus Kapabacteria bacterium]|nr:dihydrolipoyllysine-residue acetyltransferase [Candidatus Kapabacteria bacterium]